MLPRRIPFNQIAFVTLLGVGGGIYIYKPMFEPLRKPRSAPNNQDVKTETENTGQDVDGHKIIAQQVTSATNTEATPVASVAK